MSKIVLKKKEIAIIVIVIPPEMVTFIKNIVKVMFNSLFRG